MEKNETNTTKTQNTATVFISAKALKFIKEFQGLKYEINGVEIGEESPLNSKIKEQRSSEG